MQPPRVAHVINSIGLGGVPEAVFQLLRAMPADGCLPMIYALRSPAPTDEARAERLSRLRTLGEVSLGEPAEDRLSIVTQLHGWLSARRPHIVHTHSYKPNLHGRLAAGLLRRDGAKVVAHYHNQYDSQWTRDGTRALDAALAHETDMILACSTSVAQHVTEALSLVPGRVTVLPNGVDPTAFARRSTQDEARRILGLPRGRRIVGLVGRISQQKGQDDLVRAAARIRRSVPDVLLVLAGAPDAPEGLAALQALVHDLGLADCVQTLGFVADIAAFYSAIDVLAAPSRWEGFGLMLVEAMTAGVPIVAYAAGAIPEIVGEEGGAVLVDVGHIEGLAAAIETVLGSRELAEQLAEAGHRRAREFTWEKSARRLAALYADLCGDGP
jgi:glycosyltransferase involved in cell wall biosynthesis